MQAIVLELPNGLAEVFSREYRFDLDHEYHAFRNVANALGSVAWADDRLADTYPTAAAVVGESLEVGKSTGDVTHRPAHDLGVRPLAHARACDHHLHPRLLPS